MSMASSGLVQPAGGRWRLYSLYGVNRRDRVERCEHFLACGEDEAIRRARTRLPYFHKVEVWEQSTRLFEARGSAVDGLAGGTALSRFLRRFRWGAA